MSEPTTAVTTEHRYGPLTKSIDIEQTAQADWSCTKNRHVGSLWQLGPFDCINAYGQRFTQSRLIKCNRPISWKAALLWHNKILT